MSDLDLLIKLTSLPENLKQEVIDFIDFLKSKKEIKESSKIVRKPGLGKGLIGLTDDFDEPLHWS
uniref:type II toxin-antitoxin system VapB family antitoxin n=1 Tax=Roseivirga sp. TaxID=1964215 RepID=UPI0040474AB2